MSFEREEQLRQQIRDLDEQRRVATRALGEEQADEHWQTGNRGQAMVVLHNYGFDGADLIRFARRRGLSEDEARQVIRDAPIDWS
jgi:hypothetical protein